MESIKKTFAQVPGNPGVWVFLFIELTTFALLFCSYSIVSRLRADAFQHDQQLLSPTFGAINTLLLLTGGLSIALAVISNRKKGFLYTKLFLFSTLFFGACYLSIKFYEWALLYSTGITMGSTIFFGFYYFLSVFHWLHVLLGIVFIVFLISRCPKRSISKEYSISLESVASYWHMIDLLWVMLFLLVYIL